jgi:hypothetical protein
MEGSEVKEWQGGIVIFREAMDVAEEFAKKNPCLRENPKIQKSKIKQIPIFNIRNSKDIKVRN